MRNLYLLSLLILHALSGECAFAQHGNFGIGYSINYYHHSLDNPKASLVMLNYSDREWYSDKVNIVPFSYGWHVETRTRSGFVLNFTLQKNKSSGGGTNPTSGGEEVFELKHFNGRVGMGFKTSNSRSSFGWTFDMGVAGYKYRVTGDPNSQAEFDSWSNLKCIMYGSTTSFEYYLSSHIGIRGMWYWHWLAMKTTIQVHDLKLKYSTLGLGLFLYVRRNYE